MKRFLIVIKKSKDGFGAYSPDLPGCVAVGKTREEAEENMYQAIAMHIEGMREDGISIPAAESLAEYMILPEVEKHKEEPQAEPGRQPEVEISDR